MTLPAWQQRANGLLPRLDALASPSDLWLSCLLCAVGAVGLGYALQISNGTLHPEAIVFLIVTLSATTLALTQLRLGFVERFSDQLVVLGLGGGLVLGLAIHLTTVPGVYLRVAPSAFVLHHQLVAGLAVLAGAGLSSKPWLGATRILLLLATAFALGLWLLHASPEPNIDVWVWHREAYQALGHGENPYALTMPNVYGTLDWYAPGLADSTHVFVGYPYPPVTLALGAIGHLAAGDYRYSNLGAIVGAAGLIAFCRPGRVAPTAAAILLLSPRSLFVLEQGWTEATAMLAFALTVFCACRAPRLLPYAFGAMLATKQYFILCAPFAFLLFPRPLDVRTAWVFTWKAVVVACALTLPFFLWNPRVFIDSVLMFQARQPFRVDSLSFVAWTMRDGVPRLPLWAGFLALLPAYLLALARAPRTPMGFAAASALMFTMFFAFSKQAFCNYYFLIVAVLCSAVAAAQPIAVSAASTADIGTQTGSS